MPVWARSASVWLTRAKASGGHSRAHAALNASSSALSDPLGKMGLLSVISSSSLQDVRCAGLEHPGIFSLPLAGLTHILQLKSGSWLHLVMQGGESRRLDPAG